MIFKWKMLGALMCVLSCCFTHGQNSTKSLHWLDADSISLCDFYKKCGHADSIIYIRLNGERINVGTKIKYLGGLNSLNTFCDSAYYNRPDYNYQELNATADYCILFDKDLHIKEIRIYKRFGYDNKNYNYDGLVKNILLKTEGKWIKAGAPLTEWQFYFGHFKLR